MGEAINQCLDSNGCFLVVFVGHVVFALALMAGISWWAQQPFKRLLPCLSCGGSQWHEGIDPSKCCADCCAECSEAPHA